MSATIDALRAMIGTVGNVSDTVLERALDAGRHRVLAGPPRIAPQHEDNPAVEYAILLDAAKLFKRRQSPEGVAGWTDLGVIRIQPFDHDVERLTAPYRDYTDAGVS